METAFAKPENALKRAEELLNVGQKQEAWETIRRVITSRRYRAWTKTLERVMLKYIELCVDMRKGAKEGLNQYRIMCQQVNVSSLEEVIKHYMHLSMEKAEVARKKADALEEVLDVDDLEAHKRPEDLMLSYVSGQKGKDRSDCELVTPWFKFLWETYRTVLEVLRNNSKLEALYAMTAHHAFQFCKQFKRITEFRRLCDIIRNHLVNLNKYKDQRDRPDLSAPESLQLYLDTRFEQLKIASELELWQEAFRSMEDIHGLMCMVKKQPKPSLLVIYYSKLAETFWKSSCHLYHAYAWMKLFSLQKSFNKNLTQKDLQLIASSVVLAAISVPHDLSRWSSHLELEKGNQRNLRMANLIGFNLDYKLVGGEQLSRSSLLAELVSKGVLTCATQEVKDLYHLLEHEFLPLDLASRVQPLLIKVSKIGGKVSSASSLPEVLLSQYIPALEKLAALRLLKQVSRVYHSVKIESFAKLIPFFDQPLLEKISAEAVKFNFLSMKIDHGKGAVTFNIQGFEADNFHDQLVVFAESLNKSKAMIYPARAKACKLQEILPGLSEIVEKEHKRLLARKSIIENRKEEHERLLLQMEQDEESKRLKLQRLAEDEEKKRIEFEIEQRKIERIRREIQEKEFEDTQKLLEAVEKRNKKKGKKPVIDVGIITKNTLEELERNELLKKKQDLEKKVEKFSKTMDYFERAKREEAAPLIESAFQHRLVEERSLHEYEQLHEIELSQQRHDGDLKEKSRLARMLDQKMIFQDKVMNRRQEEYDRLITERAEQTERMLQERRREREEKRKMLFYLKLNERLKKFQEEEEARIREEVERQKKKEAAEHQAKLDEIAEKQRQRLLELEEKERLRREAILGRSSDRHLIPDSANGINQTGLGATAQPPGAETLTPAAEATAPAPAKYVPKFKMRLENSGQASASAPDFDRWDNRRSDERRPSDRARGYGFGSGGSTRYSRPSGR